MELADRVSESVIKIFHNAKGSIVNDVARWKKDLDTEYEQSNSSSATKQVQNLKQDSLSDDHEQYKTLINQ